MNTKIPTCKDLLMNIGDKNCDDLLPGCAREFGTIQTTLKGVDAKLDKIVSSLDGNGREGIILRVDRIEQTDKKIREDRKIHDKKMWLCLSTIGGVVVAILGKILWTLIAG